ncbi:MAG: Do family serine endopeptidase [Gemmatimonadetes bacterium]|nr:Do family serine endopeptidase [Gemmatimonadota bacterium]
MATTTWLVRRALAAALLLPAACGREAAQAQDPNRLRSEVRERLGEVPAVLDTATAARLSGAFRGAADRALPAVVYVQVISQPEPEQRSGGRVPRIFPFFDIPGAEEFFEPRPRAGTGSGFIFDERGYIMTNRHVVEGANQVLVRLVDGREFDAKVVGADPNTDVAVIRIEPREGQRLALAQLGNSDELQVGDWVLALGNPLGLDFTVTAGIVSAKGRSIGILQRERPDAPTLEAFIQTDAAINPGNSGGPLVDLLGRVVGLNTAIESPTGYFSGAGFAIPINLATRVARDLIEFGVVRRPRLGVTIADVTAADAEVYGLSEIAGAEITSVQPGTPADRAGLRLGDVMLAVDGKEIRRASELQTTLARHKPGERVRLTVWRDKKRTELTVELAQFETPAAREPERAARPAAEQLLGFRAANLTPALAARLRIEQTGGVVITDVPPLSPAAQAGVQHGQIVLRLNGNRVDDVGDLERLARNLRPGTVVSLLVRDARVGETIINYRTRP